MNNQLNTSLRLQLPSSARFSTPTTALYYQPARAPRPVRAKQAVIMSVAGVPTDDASRRKEMEAMAQRLAAKFADVRNVTPAELNTMIAEGEKVVIIDARTPEEYAVSHLPAAITLDQFEARRAQLEGSTIACYCTVGYRSSQLAGKLSKEGWNAANLQGSILAWVHDGLPLVAGTPGQEVPTKEIHVFGKQWALQPSDYKAVTFERPFWSLGKSMVTSFFSKWFGGGST